MSATNSPKDDPDSNSVRHDEPGAHIRYRASFDLAPIGLAHVAPDGAWEAVNQRFCDMLGYSRDELLSLRFQQLTYPDDLSQDVGYLEAMLAGRIDHYSMEKRYFQKDGTVLWASVTASLVRDQDTGAPLHFIAAVEDIAARKEAEAVITQAYERYRFLADTMPQIVWTAAPDGSIDYYNQQWFTYTGLTAEETRDPGWKRALHPDDLQECNARWDHAYTTGKTFEIEYRFRRALDKTYRWHLGRAYPMRDQNGHILQWVGTCTDIHDQKQAEGQRRAFLREMLSSVTEGKLRLCDTSADLPDPLSPVGEPIQLDSIRSLHSVRHLAQDAAQALGFSDLRWQHLITATSEIAMNAIQHAGGGVARVCSDGARAVQVWVEDTGSGITIQDLPRATLERGYSGAGTLGHGFWLALQTVDCLYLLTGPDGTTVVLEQRSAAGEPAWLK